MLYCNMCSYAAKTIENLTSHICRIHRFDPKFHVYCESCLRSYTKWDSYKKHLQRGCSIVSSSTQESAPESITSSPLPVMNCMDEGESQKYNEQPEHCEAIEDDWHEAKYILSVKEKHVLSQVAVDEIIGCTKSLVSDILTEVVDAAQGRVPPNSLKLLQSKITGF